MLSKFHLEELEIMTAEVIHQKVRTVKNTEVLLKAKERIFPLMVSSLCASNYRKIYNLVVE